MSAEAGREARRAAAAFPPRDRIDHREVKAAVAAVDELLAREADARAGVEAAEGALVAARAVDRDALAAAIRAGGEDPGDSVVAGVAADLEAARRLHGATEAAVGSAYVDLVAVMEEHRRAWAGRLNRRVEERRVRLAKAVEALADAQEDYAATMGLRAWAERFPTIKAPRVAWRLEGLASPNGDGYSAAAVLVALREAARDPAAEPALDVVPAVVSG